MKLISKTSISYEDVLLSIPTGKNKAVKASYIANKLHCHINMSEPHIRRMIRGLIESGFLIGSCQDGYFIIETTEEFEEYEWNLKFRATGIFKRLQMLRKNWHKKQQVKMVM